MIRCIMRNSITLLKKKCPGSEKCTETWDLRRLHRCIGVLYLRLISLSSLRTSLQSEKKWWLRKVYDADAGLSYHLLITASEEFTGVVVRLSTVLLRTYLLTDSMLSLVRPISRRAAAILVCSPSSVIHRSTSSPSTGDPPHEQRRSHRSRPAQWAEAPGAAGAPDLQVELAPAF